MAWAKGNGFTVITNDLDFSAILASTRGEGPSVVQIRAQDLSPAALGPTLLAVLRTHAGRARSRRDRDLRPAHRAGQDPPVVLRVNAFRTTRTAYAAISA